MDDFDVLALSAFGLSWLPIFPDPYYHVEHVNFWEWLYREINEVLTGERARFHSQLGFTSVLLGRLDKAYELSSYAAILRKYLRMKQPKKILEWGPGISTRIMAAEVPDAEIYSIEHDVQWFERLQDLQNNSKVHLFCIPLGDNYLKFPASLGLKFDLIFVDGEAVSIPVDSANFREKCLAESPFLLQDNGLVVIHDSNTAWYGNTRFCFETIEEADRTAVLKPIEENNSVGTR